MPDDAHGGFVDEGAGRGESTRLIDLAAINNADRRLRLRRNGVQFDAPRNE